MVSQLLRSKRIRMLSPRLRMSRKFAQVHTLRKIKATNGTRLAVVVHLYYPEIWPSINRKLKTINVPFDLYVSVQEDCSNLEITKINNWHGTTNVLTYPNRGRDVLPFLQIARLLKRKRTYKYVLKLHTKKSPHRKDGSDWLASLLDELVPSDPSKVISFLEKSDTGVIGPATHVVSLSRYLGDNRENIEAILCNLEKKDRVSELINKASLYPFFGGTMFWMRLDLIDPIVNSALTVDDFENEEGQVDGTTAHALERIFGGLLHKIMNKKMYTVGDAGVQILPEKLYEEEYRYVG